MDEKLKAFKNLSVIFAKHNFSIFLVGGTVRDYLLGKEIVDLDCASDATVEQINTFLSGDCSFAKYGNVILSFEGYKFAITTFRKEKHYFDFRHPSKVMFVKNIRQDVKRRDFTINGLYMDSDLKIYDFVKGKKDLNRRIVKTIGNPYKRIKEDPLRILRAFRFAFLLSFEIDKKLDKAIKKYIHLLKKIKKEKIIQEIKKIDLSKIGKFFMYLDKYSIQYIKDMIK